MIPVLLSMIAGACFLFAAVRHQERGEMADARKCVVMTIISLAMLGVSIACEVASRLDDRPSATRHSSSV